jgi:RimJ/RimL family protein N-acetyltransferase
LPIETERLRLRRYEERDLEDILEYSLDVDFWIARNLGWPASKEGVREYWESQREVDPSTDPEWWDLVVELTAEGRAIGHVGIGVVKSGGGRQGTVGWLVGRKYQRQGFGTEAARALIEVGFDRLRLHRISARTGSDNVASWRLMEKLNMRREAHFKESHMINGQWRDEVIYAVLASEWSAVARHGSSQGSATVGSGGTKCSGDRCELG